MDVPYLISIAPFADKETISVLALKMHGKQDPMVLCVKRPLSHVEQRALFPFLERETLAQLLKGHLENKEEK